MKLYFLAPFTLLHLSATFGATFATPEDNNANQQRFDIRRGLFNKMGNLNPITQYCRI